MATKIFTANIFIGELDNPYVLTDMVIKKLPYHILFSNNDLLDRIKHRVPDTIWKELKKDKNTKLPNIKIHFVKEMGIVNQEPIIEAYQPNY